MYLDVFSLDLLVLSAVLASPRFPAYVFSVQSSYVLLKAYFLSRYDVFFLWVCWCSQQFWLLPGSQRTFSVYSRYVLLKAYLLSRCI